MHIVYAVSSCSDGAYRTLFENAPVKPSFQAQKYHRLFMTGLAHWVKVETVANPPVNREILHRSYLHLRDETEDGVIYHYVPVWKNPVLKLISVGFGTFFAVLGRLKADSVVVVDCLNRTTALAALLAARLRGKRCVGILTDLPDMLGETGLTRKMADFVIAHCTDYVFLTQAMAERVNRKHRPYVVLEGHADAQMEERHPNPEKKDHPRVCLYAGGISRQYGLHNLVEGFLNAKLPDTRLEIYGTGDYVPELTELAKVHPNLRYGGMLLSTQVVEKEMTATLLVNPRPTGAEFVKYSFPSKTMEYMASGTPVLTTCLPGMPKEYEPYVYFIRDETPEGIAHALEKVLSQGDEELFAKGARARKFVLEQRNNVQQAKRLICLLEGEKS